MNRSAWLFVFLCISAVASADGQQTRDSEGNPAAATDVAKPNDPFFDKQYYFEKMHVLEAWAITRGSPEVLIGVVELGFDASHEEFQKGNVEVYQVPGMKHDPEDWRSRNHGTQIVGTIIAEAGNGKGIAGLAPDCRVLVAEVGTDEGYDTLVGGTGTEKGSGTPNPETRVFTKDGEAIRYLTDRGCKVINISGIVQSIIKPDLEYAIAHDVVLVVASGNANKPHPFFPKDVSPALIVGGLEPNDERWVDEHLTRNGEIFSGSNYGEGLDVMAPCRDIIFCTHNSARDKGLLPKDHWMDTNFGPQRQGYCHRINGGGTSGAAPMATALVALIRSIRPDLDCEAVIGIVQQGADDLGEQGWDEYTGYGRINFRRSLEIAQAWPKNNQSKQAAEAVP